jgi:hypothetical protein
MKLADIKLGMVVKHISDVVFHFPQKLIVIYIKDNAIEDDKHSPTVHCEWMSRAGDLNREDMNHHMLEKW